MGDFARQLEDEIETAYKLSSNNLGWRLLYSPESVLVGADVALIGLNPGGTEAPPRHAEFAMAPGRSAYRDEDWGKPAGQHRLQVQVLSLFDRLGVKPEEVLAGNLVPFRSPRWDALADLPAAKELGIDIWTRILERVQPSMIVVMGGEVWSFTRGIREGSEEKVSLAWGNVSGRTAATRWGRVVALPHLSTHSVITRQKSQAGLNQLFGDRWT